MKQFSEASKVALMLLALALPAVGQKPTIQLLPFTSFFVPAADACGFGVLFTPEPGRPNGERLIQFVNAASPNAAIIAGPLFVTLTNVSSGKTVNANISGPVLIGVSGISGRTDVSFGPGIPGALPAKCGDSGRAAARATLPWPGRIHD